MKIIKLIFVQILSAFILVADGVAENSVRGFAGCYILKLVPRASEPQHELDEQARKLFPTEFEIVMGDETTSGNFLIKPEVLKFGSSYPKSNSQMLSDGGIRIWWGNYSGIKLELKSKGDRLEGLAGYYADDGPVLDKWSDSAIATRVDCDLKKRELTNQGNGLNLPPKSRHLR